jgi:hypothetical protein
MSGACCCHCVARSATASLPAAPAAVDATPLRLTLAALQTPLGAAADVDGPEPLAPLPLGSAPALSTPAPTAVGLSDGCVATMSHASIPSGSFL